eukprot:8979390-Prorocentrum_lima.AAC.1
MRKASQDTAKNSQWINLNPFMLQQLRPPTLWPLTVHWSMSRAIGALPCWILDAPESCLRRERY